MCALLLSGKITIEGMVCDLGLEAARRALAIVEQVDIGGARAAQTCADTFLGQGHV